MADQNNLADQEREHELIRFRNFGDEQPLQKFKREDFLSQSFFQIVEANGQLGDLAEPPHPLEEFTVHVEIRRTDEFHLQTQKYEDLYNRGWLRGYELSDYQRLALQRKQDLGILKPINLGNLDEWHPDDIHDKIEELQSYYETHYEPQQPNNSPANRNDQLDEGINIGDEVWTEDEPDEDELILENRVEAEN